MSPTTEQHILMKLTGIEEVQDDIRERQIKQGEAIALITGKMEADAKYCTDCKSGINHTFDVVFDKQHQSDIERERLKGVNDGIQVAEARDNKKFSWRLKLVGWAFAAGASIASIYASWSQIKQAINVATQ